MKESRTDKRNAREFAKWKAKINEAGNTDFDQMSEKPLNEKEMEESLLGIANTVEPTTAKLGSNTSKKYSFDEKSGDKVRERAKGG